jgi:hypothetical protein
MQGFKKESISSVVQLARKGSFHHITGFKTYRTSYNINT